MTTLNFVGLGNVTFPDYLPNKVSFSIFITMFCSISIFLQILVCRVFWTDKEMKQLPAFQIMLMISVFDTIQLFIHISAIFYILTSRKNFEFIDFLIGAIMNSSWIVMLVLSIFLNFNRLFSIVFSFHTNCLFTPVMMKIYHLLFLLIWLIPTFLNISGLSRMVYYYPAYTWHYLAEPTFSATLRIVSAQISLVDVVFSLISHVIIFTWIYVKSEILSRKEFVISIQVLCISCFHVIGYVTWEYMPIPWDLPIGLFLGHFVWMLWNSINPILYILINPRIRGGVLSQIGIGPKMRNPAVTRVSAMTSIQL